MKGLFQFRRAAGWGAIVLLLGGLSGCGPEFEPGQAGGLPEGWRADTYGRWEMNRRLPGTQPGETMNCNDTWEVGAEALRPVEACQNFDFQPLYAQALADAQSMAAEVQCGPDCHDKTPQTQLAWSSLWCAGGEARAELMLNVLCRGAADDAFPWGPRAAPDFKPNPVPDRPGARPGVPVGFTSTPRPRQLACGAADRVELTYERTEPNFACASFDEDGLRDSAKERARWMWNKYACAAGCSKKPFQALRESWACAEAPDRDGDGTPEAAQATVTVQFNVECVPN